MSNTHPSPERRATILVVEDDGDLRDSLCMLLEQEGFAVAPAADGREALEWLERGGRPCLIMLDLMMPVMSGVEFLEALRKDPEHRDTPVVVLSAWPEQAEKARDVQGFVRKPFSLSEISEYTRRHCR